MHPVPLVRASVLDPLFAFLDANGVRCDGALELARGRLRGGPSLIPLAVGGAIWEAAARATDLPDLGLRVGAVTPVEDVLPVGALVRNARSPEWNLITRPVVPLFVSTPRPDPQPGDPTHVGRSTAFGDVALMQLVSPSSELVGDWLLSFGPTWVFPTAGSDSGSASRCSGWPRSPTSTARSGTSS